MPRIRVDNAGAIGLIEDIPELELAPEGWTFLQNFRPNPRGLEAFLGHRRALGTETTPWPAASLALFPSDSPTNPYWISASAAAIHTRGIGSAYTQVDRTRTVGGAYNATADEKWNACRFQNFMILTNYFDEPQFWEIGVGTDFENLSAIGAAPDEWPAGYAARLMRSIGPYLIGLNIKGGGSTNPYMVKWSSPAIAGAMPASWNAADPTEQANEYSLIESGMATAQGGAILAAERLRNSLLIYKQNEVWEMSYVGGQVVFGFNRVISSIGALGPHAVCKFLEKQEMHFAAGVDDIVVHNGQSTQSILNDRVRRWLYNQIDPNYFHRCFSVPNPAYNEVWFCYPELGYEQPNIALVWNTQSGAIGFRDLLKVSDGRVARTTAATKGTPHINLGVVYDTSSQTCAMLVGPADSYTYSCNFRSYSPVTQRLLMADRSADLCTYVLDETTMFDTQLNIECIAERKSLTIAAQSRQQEAKADTESLKLVTEIWPRIVGPADGTYYMQAGAQQEMQGAVTWDTLKTFTLGSQSKVDTYISGRLLAFRLLAYSSQYTKGPFVFTGYEMNVARVGSY